MDGRDPSNGRTRTIVYCLIPRDLAPKLHETLRRHFRDDQAIEVVVERRVSERRVAADRRDGAASATSGERRRIRAASGRRVADRRAIQVSVTEPPVPRRVRAFADRVAFVERIEPLGLHAEDADTARLVTRFQAGERDVFAIIYTRYFERVYSYFRVALNDRHGAEDLVQQVFAKVLEALPQHERREGKLFRAWLFTIARNEAVDELQRRRRSSTAAPEEIERRREEAEHAAGGLNVLDWISDRELSMFVERLPLAQRQVLLLRYMLGFGYPEIASMLGRSTVDVRSLNSRGLRYLRQRLREIGRGAPVRRREHARARVRWARVASSRRWALHR